MKNLIERLNRTNRRFDMKIARVAGNSGRAVGVAGQWLAAIMLTAPIVGCSLLDKGLEATAPDKIETSTLELPANAGLLVNSAIGNFECALGMYIVDAGMMSGELMDATPTAANWAFDRRDTDPTADTRYASNDCESYGIYTPIQIARGTADRSLQLLQGWTDAEVPGRQDLIAKAAAYDGYSILLLGEGFCEAAIDLGPLMTSAQIFAAAEAKFTTAITAAQAAGDAKILNMAYVGRARARLDQGNKNGAASDAALVPPGFVIYATAENAPTRRQNRVFTFNQAGLVSVAPVYRDAATSGVTVVYAGKNGTDNRTPLYIQTKYASSSSPIPIASYTEAQLILAEAQGSQTVAADRARVLFLEGQHLDDVRRLNLPLIPAAGIPYSTVYLKGGNYGSERCFPLPDVERLNNPNI
jgi:hypothetical protein